MSIVTIVFMSFFVVSLVALLLFLRWVANKGKVQLSTGSGHPEGTAMNPFLYMGVLYVNPKDPRGWLPKQWPMMGWTVNFRDRKYANLFIILLVMTLLFAWGFAASLM